MYKQGKILSTALNLAYFSSFTIINTKLFLVAIVAPSL